MSDSQNRLEIAISAKDEFSQTMSRLGQAAQAAGQAASSALTEAGNDSESAFDGASEAAKEMGRQTELALESIMEEARQLQSDLELALDGDVSDELSKALENLQRELEKTGNDGRQDLAKVEKALDEVKSAAGAAARNARDLQDINLANLIDQVRDLGDGLSSTAQAALAVFGASGQEVLNFEDRIKAAYESISDQSQIIAAGENIKKTFGTAFKLDDVAEGAQMFKRFGINAKQAAEDLARAARVARVESKAIGEVSEALGEALRPDSYDAGIFEEISTQLGIGGEALARYGAKVDENKKIIAETTAEQELARRALRTYIDESERYSGVAARVTTNYGKAQAEVGKFNRGVGEQYNKVKELAAGAILPLLEYVNQMPGAFKAAGVGIAGLAVSASVGSKLVHLYGIVKLLSGATGIGGIGKAAAEAGQAATKLSPLSSAAAKAKVGMEGLRAASQGAALSAGVAAAAYAALAVAVVATAVTFYQYRQSVEDAQKAEEALIETENRAINQHERRGKMAKQSADEIIAAADREKSSAEQRIVLTDGLIVKKAALNKAIRDGDKSAEEAAKKEVNQLQARRNWIDELAGFEVSTEKAKKKAIEDTYKAAEDAFLEYQRAVQLGSFDTKKTQLAALESLSGNLRGDIKAKALQEIKALSGEILATELANLQKVAEAEDLSAKETKARWESLKAEYQVYGDAKTQIEEQFESGQKSRDEARASRTRALQQEELDLKRSALELQKGALVASDAEIETLTAKLEVGKNVVKELEKELSAKAKSAKHNLDEEASLNRVLSMRKANDQASKEPNQANKVKIYELEAERQKQINEKLAQDKASVDRQLAKDQEGVAKKRSDYETAQAQKKLELEQKRADLTLQTYDQEKSAADDLHQEKLKQLQDQAAMGVNVTAQIKKLEDDRAKTQKAAVEERLALEIAAIKARETAENSAKGVTDEEKKLNTMKAQLEISKLQDQAKKATTTIVNQNLDLLRAETAELVKQRDLLVEQTKEKKKGFDSSIQGGAQSVEEAFSGNSSGWGVSRKDRATDQAGNTVEDYDREIAKRRAKIANEEAGQRRRDDAGTPIMPWGKGAAPPGRRPAISDTPQMAPAADMAPLLAATQQQDATLKQILAVLSRQGTSSLMDFSRGGSRLQGLG